MFASAKYGISPDIICLAKADGGGMPLGGVASNKRTLYSFTHNPCLGHITTFGGHPVCCAAGLAALNYIIDNNIVEQVERKGALFEERLGSHPRVLEIRRSGLLLALELGKPEYLYRLMEIFKEEGIMSDWFLYCDTAFRISPPLTISEQEIEECCEIIRHSLDRL
jgi:acetylornithine/succinyldiaminopimelate/putrescine aminotransferase